MITISHGDLLTAEVDALVFDTGQHGQRQYVINFPTKAHWRLPSQLGDVKAGLEDLVEVIRSRRIGSIALPALGCGNGGLDWAAVRPMIEDAFARVPEVEVLLFPPGR